MYNLNIELPDYQAIKQVSAKIFDENAVLEKKKRELGNISTFINDLKAKLPESHKFI